MVIWDCRERDEDLDEITLSAQQLLGRLGTLVHKTVEEQEQCVALTDIHQRITILALFVSDCFGGSDKTQSVTNMRRAALGGTAGAPFVCSCSSNLNSSSANPYAESSIGSFHGTALPTVHGLCEDTVRHLKAQRGSNVLPIGSLRFGVCRHRAILLKVSNKLHVCYLLEMVFEEFSLLQHMRFFIHSFFHSFIHSYWRQKFIIIHLPHTKHINWVIDGH
jgi:hypothetical protein